MISVNMSRKVNAYPGNFKILFICVLAICFMMIPFIAQAGDDPDDGNQNISSNAGKGEDKGGKSGDSIKDKTTQSSSGGGQSIGDLQKKMKDKESTSTTIKDVINTKTSDGTATTTQSSTASQGDDSNQAGQVQAPANQPVQTPGSIGPGYGSPGKQPGAGGPGVRRPGGKRPVRPGRR